MTDDTTHGTHTPGNWAAANEEGDVLVMRGMTYIAKVYGGLFDNQQDANARLIAAAPDMYEALPDLIECAEMLAAQCRMAGEEAHANMYQARAERGRAALSKSEGRP